MICQKTGKELIGWAMILNNIGNVHYNQGKIEEALEYYHKTLNIYKKIGNESID